MILTLKPEYAGLTLSRIVAEIGFQITFNSLTVPPEYYINYYNLGFKNIFQEVYTKEPKKNKNK